MSLLCVVGEGVRYACNYVMYSKCSKCSPLVVFLCDHVD